MAMTREHTTPNAKSVPIAEVLSVRLQCADPMRLTTCTEPCSPSSGVFHYEIVTFCICFLRYTQSVF